MCVCVRQREPETRRKERERRRALPVRGETECKFLSAKKRMIEGVAWRKWQQNVESSLTTAHALATGQSEREGKLASEREGSIKGEEAAMKERVAETRW